jgi:hypothetical protein
MDSWFPMSQKRDMGHPGLWGCGGKQILRRAQDDNFLGDGYGVADAFAEGWFMTRLLRLGCLVADWCLFSGGGGI